MFSDLGYAAAASSRLRERHGYYYEKQWEKYRDREEMHAEGEGYRR